MSNPYKYDKAPFEVCIVNYTCGNCCRRWKSANGNLNDYQLCKNCYEKCYPGSYRYQAPNKRGNQNRETFIAHNTELCGKCIRLGYSCIEDVGNESTGIVVSNLEGEEMTLEAADFSQYFTFAETKKKDGLVNKKSSPKKAKQQKEKQEWLDLLNEGKKKNQDEKINKSSGDEKIIIDSMINNLNISTPAAANDSTNIKPRQAAHNTNNSGSNVSTKDGMANGSGRNGCRYV